MKEATDKNTQQEKRTWVTPEIELIGKDDVLGGNVGLAEGAPSFGTIS